ncbi:MAG TPA: HI0074 family nucleotidyltransferase substrate-binding subunit [Micavibrio sp.]|jgi:nucleotidyltransferase substrate binding protein (TIGR01987 family)
MKLDLSNFKKAIQQLEQSLEFCNSDLARSDQKVMRQFRMAAIQAFEYTYELSWKMLRRFLDEMEGSPLEADMSFADLIRTGNEHGLLLGDWPQWRIFREKRAISSHTYDEAKAEDVFTIIPRMLEEARHLCQRLESRND